MATTRPVSLVHLRAAHDDLEWLFTSAEGAMGLQAQVYDGLSGGVFDDDASARLHMRVLDMRKVVVRFRRVRAAFHSLTPERQRVLSAAYAPRAWSFSLTEAMAMKGWSGSAVGVAMLTTAAVVAWAKLRRVHPPMAAPTGQAIVATLTEAAFSPTARRTFAPIREEAFAMLSDALGAFDSATRAYLREAA